MGYEDEGRALVVVIIRIGGGVFPPRGLGCASVFDLAELYNNFSVIITVWLELVN